MMTTETPCIFTSRLILKVLQKHQAETLFNIANEPLIAANTSSLPSPYTLEAANSFIEGMQDGFHLKGMLSLGMHLRKSDELIGMISLRIDTTHHGGHLGYWVAAHCRDKGYATEASTGLMDYGFAELGLYRVSGQCFARNKASARVLERIGLRYEGCMRAGVLKNGVYEDMLVFAMLRHEWEAQTCTAR